MPHGRHSPGGRRVRKRPDNANHKTTNSRFIGRRRHGWLAAQTRIIQGELAQADRKMNRGLKPSEKEARGKPVRWPPRAAGHGLPAHPE